MPGFQINAQYKQSDTGEDHARFHEKVPLYPDGSTTRFYRFCSSGHQLHDPCGDNNGNQHHHEQQYELNNKYEYLHEYQHQYEHEYQHELCHYRGRSDQWHDHTSRTYGPGQ